MATKRAGAVLAGFIVVGALVVGCGSSAERSPSQGDDSSEAPSAVEGQQGATGADSGGATADQASTDVNVLDVAPQEAGRSVISTATLSIETDNVVEAKQRATTVAESAGGMVFDEETELGDRARSTLTLRVPPDRFDKVVDDLAGIGTLTNQDISTEDVTAQVVDLDARIATAEVSVNRLRGFLDQATTVSEITQLEQELMTRESSLESLRGQKRTLEGRIDLATIVVTLAPPPTVALATERADSLPGFLDGLSGGWNAFLDIATVTAAMAGWLLPFLPFLIGAVVLVRWYLRRRPDRPAPTHHLPPPPV